MWPDGRPIRCTVTGHVSAGALMGIDGVHVKVMFVWVPMSAIHRPGDKLYFQAGPVSAASRGYICHSPNLQLSIERYLM
jgi:hypothetical protein